MATGGERKNSCGIDSSLGNNGVSGRWGWLEQGQCGSNGGSKNSSKGQGGGQRGVNNSVKRGSDAATTAARTMARETR